MKRDIGDIIFLLRVEKGISQKSLARGIISVPELSRIERGEREVDKILLEAIFQRLGKSVDKFEFAVSEEEYRITFLRSLIIENLIDKKNEDVENLLNEYMDLPQGKKTLHKQYIKQMKSINNYLTTKNKAKSIELMQEALTITLPGGINSNWEEYLLCGQEVQILQIVSYLLMENGEDKEAEKLLTKLEKLIETDYTDGEEKVKVYPQCSWLLSKIYLKQGNVKKAYKISQDGKKCVIENGAMTLLNELLKMEIICLYAMGKEEEVKYIKKQRMAVIFLYKMAGRKIPHDIIYILLGNQLNELIISNELIKELRVELKLSQEELSEDICAPETLSRIESGMRTPNSKNLYEILCKMGMDRSLYHGFVVAKNYNTYEKVRFFHRDWFKEDMRTVKQLLKEIEDDIDMDNMFNRQFIDGIKLVIKIKEGLINLDDAIKELAEVLQYTMKRYQGIVYRVPFREECVILNQIALCFKRKGDSSEACEVYQHIIDRYEQSRVLAQHHAISILLICINYVNLLEEINELEKAEKIGKRGLSIAIDCGRGDAAAILLANLSCIYVSDKRPEKESLCEYGLRSGYYLLEMYGHEKDSSVVKKYYEDLFKKELIS